MDTLRLLRARLDEILDAQPLVVREFAQLIFQIPRILDSQVYGFILRHPGVFVSFLWVQLRLSGDQLPSEDASSGNLTAQVNELRVFLYIHMRRLDLVGDPAYSLCLLRPEGVPLPDGSQNLQFANAFLTVAESLLPEGHTLPNHSGDLVQFARAFLSAAGRSQPGLLQLVRGTRFSSLAFAHFVISLYNGLPDTSDYSPIIPGIDAAAAQVFRATARMMAALISSRSLGDLTDIVGQFRRAPRGPSTSSLPVPRDLNVFSLGRWHGLTLGEQDMAFVLGSHIRSRDLHLWFDVCRDEEAFLTYCRQLLAGYFDIADFPTSNAHVFTDQLMHFIQDDSDLQSTLEGIRWLHNPREMQPADAREWNARLFAQWKTESHYDDNEDVDILTENLLSGELLEMAALTRTLNVLLLTTGDQLSAKPAPHAPFPGFEAAETLELAIGTSGDFDDVCLFCITRLCDPGQASGEPVYTLPCCHARVGSVCLKAYKRSSASCPFCSQAT